MSGLKYQWGRSLPHAMDNLIVSVGPCFLLLSRRTDGARSRRCCEDHDRRCATHLQAPAGRKGARAPRGCCTVLADTTSTDPSVLADGPTTNLLCR